MNRNNRIVSEIQDLISEVENGNYYGEKDFDIILRLFYADVRIITEYEGDE